MSRRRAYRPKPNPIADSTRLLRDLTGREHTHLAGRGASGIYAALRALGLRDQYVMIPANTCYIVLWAVLRSGNKPLLVDVDLGTGNWTLDTLSANSNHQIVKTTAFNHRGTEDTEKKYKSAAMIPCHMYGLAAPIREICEWARERDMYVIEDAALALGATVDGRPAGSWGDASILSFGLGKIADHQVGGAVLTDDERLSAEIERILADMPEWDDLHLSLTNQWNAIYWALHQYEADNPKLSALYPALYDIYGGLTTYRLPTDDWDDLPTLLRHLPDNLSHRSRLASIYDKLTEIPALRTLPRPDGSILWRYPLLVAPEHRNDLLQYLWDHGIQDATRWYPPLRYMTAALAPDIPQPPTPNADALGASIINLRLDEGVDPAYAVKTVELIHAYFEQTEN